MLDKLSSTSSYESGKNYLASEIEQNRDLRSPGYLKLAGKELSYRLKIVLLFVLDSFSLLLGWIFANLCDWNKLGESNLSYLWRDSEASLFLTVLAFMVFLFSAYDLYRKGDKSRNLSNTITAIFLAHLAVIPIVLRFYDPKIIYQLLIAGLLTTILVLKLWLTILLLTTG
ncbi:MAG: sugar transferase, partial [Cyanobacteria bacterium J06642_3]